MTELLLFTFATLIPILMGVYSVHRVAKGELGPLEWFMYPIVFMGGWILTVMVEVGFYFIGSTIVFLFTEYSK